MNDALESVVSARWLADRIGTPSLRVLNASRVIGDAACNPKAEFLCRHVPGAQYFDLVAAGKPDAALAHTLPERAHFDRYIPERAHFDRYISSLGISRGDLIVIYDNCGLAPSARAWWMFKVFDYGRTCVLDGGLPAWLRAGLQTESGEADVRSASEAAAPNRPSDRRRYASAEAVEAAPLHGIQIIDARSPGRFWGLEVEPRSGVRSGHIPGSRNVHFTRLLDDEGMFLLREAMREVFVSEGLDPDWPSICSGGSGVTACVLALALDYLGNRNVAVYDGSWSELATRSVALDRLRFPYFPSDSGVNS